MKDKVYTHNEKELNLQKYKRFSCCRFYYLPDRQTWFTISWSDAKRKWGKYAAKDEDAEEEKQKSFILKFLRNKETKTKKKKNK